MTEPTSPDLQFDDLLTALSDNNVGGITPEDVRSIAALSRPNSASIGGAGISSTTFGGKLSGGDKLDTNTDITYLRLVDLYSLTSTAKHSNYEGKLSLLDGGSGKIGVKYDAAAADFQPRTFRYEWDLVLESTNQTFWALTFYYMPSGASWPTTTTSTDWGALKTHHSRVFFDANGRTIDGEDKWQSRTSGTKSIILNPGDTVVPVLEYWGNSSGSTAPGEPVVTVSKWSFDMVSTGVAPDNWNADGKYFDVANNRSTVTFDLTDLTAAATPDDGVLNQPVIIQPVGVTKSMLSTTVSAGTVVYLKDDKCLYVFRGGTAPTSADWVLVRDFNNYLDGSRPVVADTTVNLGTSYLNDYDAGSLAYDTTTKELKVHDGSLWQTFATRQSAGKYPRVISLASTTSPALTLANYAPGTVFFDEGTKELKVSDGTTLYTVNDLNGGASLPTGGNVGQQFYLTATVGTGGATNYPGLYTYSSATAGVGWTKPWNMAWGQLAAATVNTDQSIASGTAVPGVAMTGFDSGAVTVPVGRMLKISFRATLTQAGTPGNLLITLNRAINGGSSGSVTRMWSMDSVAVTSQYNTVSGFHIETTSAVTPVAGAPGSIRYTAYLHNSAGTTTVKNTAAIGILTVEDIGPAAAPGA